MDSPRSKASRCWPSCTATSGSSTRRWRSTTRTPNGITQLVELAELLQAPVNGGGDRVNFPSRHPLAGQGDGAADVILNLEVQGGGDRVSAGPPARPARRRSA